VNRSELQHLARVRLAEAQALLGLRMYDGAYYLAGYAVECGLKACIAKKVPRHTFPDLELARKSYTHSLNELVKIAGLEADRKATGVASPAFAVNWLVVKDWTEVSRYATHTARDAADICAAIADRRNGVMVWIRRHW
jgi:HEPN domain-containing protein